MALYPGIEDERRVDPDVLATLVTSIFEACGMREEDARLVAGALVDADLRGIHSHGVLRVPDYVDKLTVGGVDPRGVPRVVGGRGAVAVVDGGNSMGQVGATFAMARALERAREHGVGAAALRGSNHCGAMDRYARMALEHDMIGIAATNALPTMAPWGGAQKIVGINPIAVAMPGGEEPPVVLDIAFGATAHGKIRVYAQTGHALPEGWAFDAEGVPTTDPAAALVGLIRPIGDFKGVGLAMVSGMLSSLLSGAAYGLESGNMVDGAIAGVDGQFFLALDVCAFCEPRRFRERSDAVVREVHGARRAPGVDRLFVPGEMEAGFEARYRREGVPLNARTLADIEAAARSTGVRVPAGWPGA
jgi:LDH2 family malate/lactate/ureidoglycolate dehydrogenase